MARRKRKVRRNFKLRIKFGGKLRTYRQLRKKLGSKKARKVWIRAAKYHGRTPVAIAGLRKLGKRRKHRKGYRKAHRRAAKRIRRRRGRKGRKHGKRRGRKSAKRRKHGKKRGSKRRGSKRRGGRRRRASGFASFTRSMWKKHRAKFMKMGIRKVGKHLGSLWRHGQHKAAN